MKSISKTIICCLILFASLQLNAQAPFHKGVNLTGWLQADNPGKIQYTQYSKKDFRNIKSLGCDVVRLPMNLHGFTSGAPDYTLDPVFLRFVDSAVIWAEDLQLYLILDNHSFDPAVSTSLKVGTILNKVWPQLAKRYKDRSDYIIYEILNEPHGITTAAWSTIQQQAIDAIRVIDKKHTIMVGASNWNTYTELSNLPVYSDKNLLYTFHFYEPFMFTHQGASWNTPSMVSLKGVPFPYNAAEMPSCPADLKGTWVESALSNYSNDGTVAKVKSLIDIAVNFRKSRNVNIFCGEFGVYIPNSDTADRVFWYNMVKSYLDENNIPWTTWDYQGGFGLFKKGSDEIFEHDLNIPLLKAIGFDVPPQSPTSSKPDSAGFRVYSDFLEPGCNNAGYSSGTTDFRSHTLPNNGDYCIYWTGFSQYNTIGFDFKPNRDLSRLAAEGYAVDFMVRGNEAGIKFDIRFLDSKTSDPADHPWRMGTTISDMVAPWDKRWHHVHIPLSEFTERGAWDNNSWFNPEGKFDWTKVDRFEFSTEYSGTSGKEIWIDNLMITNQDTAKVIEKGTLSVEKQPFANQFNLKSSPNPFHENTIITYTLPYSCLVQFEIFTIDGIKIATLVNEKQSAGDHTVSFDGRTKSGSNIMNGIFTGTLIAGQHVIPVKLLKR